MFSSVQETESGSTSDTAAVTIRASGFLSWARWRDAWRHSLRFRLLVLGVMPLLVAFPVMIAVVLGVGGARAESLLMSALSGNLSGARNYLDQLRTDAGARVGQIAKSERLPQLLERGVAGAQLNQQLANIARSSGFDYLALATADGVLVASSNNAPAGQKLPESFVIRQARVGVANAAYERMPLADLAALSPRFPEQARVAYEDPPPEGEQGVSSGLLINAAAHFPLAVGMPDLILVGGHLLSKNYPLIEHMREIIFPVGALPDGAEGMASVLLDDTSVATSRERLQGQRAVGTRVPADVVDTVLRDGESWRGTLDFWGQSYVVGFEPLVDGDGVRIGMVSVGFPDAPYRKLTRLVLGMIVGLFAFSMLAMSLLFVWAGRDLTGRLQLMSDTMKQVRLGRREARLGRTLRDDELGQLGRDFDGLLDTIEAQDEQQRQAQRMIADEASRRRALFEHERDGVVILNLDGSVFEANPKCAAMLGYSMEELVMLRVSDWTLHLSDEGVGALLRDVDAEGRLFELEHRRKDGSTFMAEVSVSRAQWGDRTFVLALLRDISARKASEAELARYRNDLEQQVVHRTRDLNERTELLKAIFALSPDGFLSFDHAFKVNFVNPSFLRMTGLLEAEVMGLDEAAFSARLSALCVADAQFPGMERLRERDVNDETAAHAAAHRHLRHLFELAGPMRRVLEVGLRTSDAESVSQILYLRDVTHETEVERMKSEFLTTAAHELRTPMASILGYSELLRMRDFDSDRRNEMLETITRQSEWMVAIINELLDLARIEDRRGKDFVLESCTLQDVVQQALSVFKRPTGRDSPQVEDLAGPVWIKADRSKLRQVVINLLSNAYKYSAEGSGVEVRLLPSDARGRVGLQVQDHGIGMTPAQLARVCERFYRADDSGTILGTGLGMSIVKEIVELHGAELQLASEPAQGTTVTVWIPRVQAPVGH